MAPEAPRCARPSTSVADIVGTPWAAAHQAFRCWGACRLLCPPPQHGIGPRVAPTDTSTTQTERMGTQSELSQSELLWHLVCLLAFARKLRLCGWPPLVAPCYSFLSACVISAAFAPRFLTPPLLAPLGALRQGHREGYCARGPPARVIRATRRGSQRPALLYEAITAALAGDGAQPPLGQPAAERPAAAP